MDAELKELLDLRKMDIIAEIASEIDYHVRFQLHEDGNRYTGSDIPLPGVTLILNRALENFDIRNKA